MGEKAGSGGRSASRHARGPGEDHQRSWSSDSARGTPLTGFSIVRADSLEAALEMAKGENEVVVCRGHRVGDFVRAWLGRARRRRLHGRPGGVEEPALMPAHGCVVMARKRRVDAIRSVMESRGRHRRASAILAPGSRRSVSAKVGRMPEATWASSACQNLPARAS